MTLRVHRRLSIAIAALALSGAALAQPYPTKPIKMVSPYPPGGPVDTFGRLISAKVSEDLKQPIIFENRPGATGLIAGEHVAKSPADGYTLLVSVPSLFTMVPHMVADAQERIQGLAPVAQFAVAPLLLVVHPSVDAKNVKELVGVFKSPSKDLAYASAGSGSLPHLAMELLLTSVGGRALHVSYKGSGPAVAGLLGGQVQAMLDNMSSSLPQARSGRLRALAVTSKERFSGAPEIPTLAEAGVDGYEVTNWFGIFAPAATPKEVVALLNSAFGKAAFAPQVRERLQQLGATPVAPQPEEVAAQIRKEREQWGRIIKQVGLKPKPN